MRPLVAVGAVRLVLADIDFKKRWDADVDEITDMALDRLNRMDEWQAWRPVIRVYVRQIIREATGRQ